MDEINVDKLLKSRLPRHYRFIPRFLIRGLERLICQKRLNHMLVNIGQAEGTEFCRRLLHELRVDYSLSQFPEVKESTAVTYACNHPLGALDGIALIAALTERHGVEPYFVVNDLLSVLDPLDSIFVPINKHGAQSRDAADGVRRAFADLSRPVVMFPAGLCSRQNDKGVIADLRWNKMFVQKSAEAGRDIHLLHCSAQNSPRFYRIARLRERLGVKFNLEMLLLPSEMVGYEGKSLAFRHLSVLPAAEIPTRNAAATAAALRQQVLEA